MRWVLLLTIATGCGRLGFDPTGGDGDGDGDSGPISLVVYDGGSVAVGLQVLIHDSTGALITTAQTDADGAVDAVVTPNSAVTLVWSDGDGGYWLDTQLGVQPGDALQFSDATNLGADLGTMSVQMPGVVPTAASYTVTNGCAEEPAANPNGVESGPVSRACAAGDTVSAVAIALDNAGDPLAYSGLDVAVADLGTTQTMPAWESNLFTVDFSFTNLPATAAYLDLKSENHAGAVAYHYDADGTDLPVAEPVSLQVTRPVGVNGAFVHFPCVYFPSEAASGFFISERLPSADSAIDIDFSSALPELAAVTVDPTADGRADVGVLAAGPITGVDLGVVRVSWTSADAQVEWNVVVPPDVTDFALPELPDDLAALRLVGGESFDMPAAMYLDADYIESFDDARARWWGRLLEPFHYPDEFSVLFTHTPGGF